MRKCKINTPCGFSLKMSVYLCILPRRGRRTIAITSAYKFHRAGQGVVQGQCRQGSTHRSLNLAGRRAFAISRSPRGVGLVRPSETVKLSILYYVRSILDDRSRRENSAHLLVVLRRARALPGLLLVARPYSRKRTENIARAISGLFYFINEPINPNREV